MNKLSKNKLNFFKKLLNKKYRYQFKKFIIEGKHLIEEALKSSCLECIITSDLNYRSNKISVFYTSYENICLLSKTKTPQEYIGICNFLNFNNFKLSSKILVMNKINDPGNLGTLIRTAYSFGIQDIIVEGVDIYNQKVLRATQGAIFNVNILSTKNLLEDLKQLKNKNYKLIGTLLKDANDYHSVKINNEKIIIILGNEANGIDSEIINILDYKVYIPIKFESLNVAIAGAILIAKYCN